MATLNYDDFLTGYIDGLIWASTLVTDDGEVYTLDEYAGMNNEAMLGKLAADMRADNMVTDEALFFWEDHHKDLTTALETTKTADSFSLGHDLAMEHLHTGVGYGDRDYGEAGHALADHAELVEIPINFWVETDDNGDEWIRHEIPAILATRRD